LSYNLKIISSTSIVAAANASIYAGVIVVVAAVAVAIGVVLPHLIAHSAVIFIDRCCFCFCCDLFMTGCWLCEP